jgi:hypothetical protein
MMRAMRCSVLQFLYLLHAEVVHLRQGVDERLVVEGHAEALGEHSAHRAPAAAHFAVNRYDIVLVHVYLHSFFFFDFTI